MTQNNPLKMTLIGAVATAVVVALITLLFDPTASYGSRLDAVDAMAASSHRLIASVPAKLDVARLAQAPLFVMTTGAAAYKEKTFQLFGVSISPRRKAALVSIDGATAVWMTVGSATGDIRLADVGTNGASFETPVGVKNVNLSDPVAAQPGQGASSSSNSTQGG